MEYEKIKIDSSTIDEKIALLKRGNFFNISRWEKKECNVILEDYSSLIFLRKYYKGLQEGTHEKFNQDIRTLLYSGGLNSLFANVTVTPKNASEETLPFIFNSVMLNSNVRQILMLNRFDPVGRPHPNRFFENESEIRKKYFKENAETPHFHFFNNNDLCMYKDRTTCGAISTKSLRDYINHLEDALLSNNHNDSITRDDCCMPFLSALKQKNVYDVAFIEALRILPDVLELTTDKDYDVIRDVISKINENLLLIRRKVEGRKKLSELEKKIIYLKYLLASTHVLSTALPHIESNNDKKIILQTTAALSTAFSSNINPKNALNLIVLNKKKGNEGRTI